MANEPGVRDVEKKVGKSAILVAIQSWQPSHESRRGGIEVIEHAVQTGVIEGLRGQAEQLRQCGLGEPPGGKEFGAGVEATLGREGSHDGRRGNVVALWAEGVIEEARESPFIPEGKNDGDIEIAEVGENRLRSQALRLGVGGSNDQGLALAVGAKGGLEILKSGGAPEIRERPEIGHDPEGGHAVRAAITLDELDMLVGPIVLGGADDAGVHGAVTCLY